MSFKSPQINSPTIVLGSTSPFRKEVLNKFNIPFETDKPEVDETAYDKETAMELVERLAIAKSKAVADRWSDSLVIGSDQVALFDDTILGKPHTHDNAIKQLTSFSGNKVIFLTGLAVTDTRINKTLSIVEPFEVHFKELSLKDVESYLHAEKPYKCAGSFKSEALGICLFDKLVGNDPNSLIGLPLIRLAELLKEFGYSVLDHQTT